MILLALGRDPFLMLMESEYPVFESGDESEVKWRGWIKITCIHVCVDCQTDSRRSCPWFALKLCAPFMISYIYEDLWSLSLSTYICMYVCGVVLMLVLQENSNWASNVHWSCTYIYAWMKPKTGHTIQQQGPCRMTEPTPEVWNWALVPPCPMHIHTFWQGSFLCVIQPTVP